MYINDLKRQLQKGNVILFLGTGVSASTTQGASTATWKGLLKDGIERCRALDPTLSAQWHEDTNTLTESLEVGDLVQAAGRIADRLGAPNTADYARWLREAIGELQVKDRDLLDALVALDCPIVTTNYDTLFELATGLPSIDWTQKREIHRHIRGDHHSVFHIHGRWDVPRTVVFSGQSYEKIVTDTHTEAVLKSLFFEHTILFVGFGSGLDDPNFSRVVEWAESILRESDYVHYRLMRRNEAPQKSEVGQLIRTIQYGDTFFDLPAFIRGLKPTAEAPPEEVRATASPPDADFLWQVRRLYELEGYEVTPEDEHCLLAKKVPGGGAPELKTYAVCNSRQTSMATTEASAHLAKWSAALKGPAKWLTIVQQAAPSEDLTNWAQREGVFVQTLSDLVSTTCKMGPYVEKVKKDETRNVILREYQETTLRPEGSTGAPLPVFQYLSRWLGGGTSNWLLVLGDYGVGKSWMLKRLLFKMIDDYDREPGKTPLPFFIPLQRFTKAFDFRNLLIATLDQYGLAAQLEQFLFLAKTGRVVFLLDSFDEMAQTLSRDSVKHNLKELLSGIASTSRSIMTSRPTYFQSRSERLLAETRQESELEHELDVIELRRQRLLSSELQITISRSQYARLGDLTPEQRLRLFQTVLEGKTTAQRRLQDLLNRFESVKEQARRPVIARLLTTVAETLASGEAQRTPDGYELLPESLVQLNEGKIFEIVVNNLLHRDRDVGGITAAKRLTFLRSLALLLQTRGHDFFAEPEQVRALVASLFAEDIRQSDSPQSVLENFYRTCRRHAGLTTEGQFLDTSGQIDTPVDVEDYESRVGFSHNALREFLVADAIAQLVISQRSISRHTLEVALTDAVCTFYFDIAVYRPTLQDLTSKRYVQSTDSREREFWFKLIWAFIQRQPAENIRMIGSPVMIDGIDLSGLNMSRLRLDGAHLVDCLLDETDLRGAHIERARFDGSRIKGTLLDDAKVAMADFRRADIHSILVHDDYGIHTTGILRKREARQWLYTAGALVDPVNDLNRYLGRPWYEAAREVCLTIRKRIAGTFKASALTKGTKLEQRPFAVDFVDFLDRRKVLLRVLKDGDWIYRLNEDFRQAISDFLDRGEIHPEIEQFFLKNVSEHDLNS